MRKILKDESGESAVVVALMMTVILAMAALVLDIGMAYVEASSAQNAADAIVLSVGRYLPVSQNDNIKMNTIITEAKKYAEKNGLTNFKAEDLSFEKLANGKYSSLSVNVEKVSITRLAKIIGVEDITITKSASVSTVPTGAVSGAAPVGLTEEVYDAAIASGHTNHLTLKVGGGDGVNGFYGLIVLDGSNGNANVLEKWLKYGYEGTNYVGQVLPVATGNKTSAVKSSVDFRMASCNHYVGYGGCTPEHYVKNCSRVMYIPVYRVNPDRTIIAIGFTAILLEGSDDQDEIQGSLINVNVSYFDKISDKDCGIYTFRLTE